MAGYVVPTTDATSQILEMLFGTPIEVQNAEAISPGGTNYVTTFIDDQDQLVAACIADLPFVAYSGAALSMIPGDVANEIVAEGAPTEAMLGNFYEVMNICSKLFMSDSSAHLRLDKTYSPDEGAGAIASLQASATTPFGIQVPGYGSGALTFLAA